MPLYLPPSQNALQKTLAAQLLSTATTGDPISLSDTNGVQNGYGVLVIDRVDSNNVPTAAKREYISYSSVSGSTVIIYTRNADGAGTIQTHASGAIVEFAPDVVWAQAINTALSAIVNTGTLALDLTKVVDVSTVQVVSNKILASGSTLTVPTLVSPVSNGGTFTNPIIDRPVVRTEYGAGSGASIGINLLNGDRQLIGLTATTSIFYQNATIGQVLTLRAVENATGGFPILYPTGTKFASGASAPIHTAANAINLLAVYFDGTNYLTQIAPGFS